MKKMVINIILVFSLFVVLVAIMLPFLGEVQFETAKRLEDNYRRKNAEKKYQLAIKINPFNSEYQARYGKFLTDQSRYRQEKISWLKRAEGLYERAIQLNSEHEEYLYWLGKIRLELKEIDRAIDDFRMAIDKDPYNFRINYLVGHNLLTVWSYLDDEGKNFLIARLRYVLSLKPWYANYVYPAINHYTNDFTAIQKVTPENLVGTKALFSFIKYNNLWQYRQEVAKRLDFFRQKEEPEAFHWEKVEKLEKMKKDYHLPPSNIILPENWQGKSESENFLYENGNMYWVGTIDAVIDMPKGNSTIYITAKGSPADKVFPYMIVELDGEEIGATYVKSPKWKKYPFVVSTEGGLKVLSITFANDRRNTEESEDRNLFIGMARVVREDKSSRAN